MKKEFDLKIDGGTLESIKIDSSNSLIIATYKRDAAEFKRGDILASKISSLVLIFDKYISHNAFSSLINNKDQDRSSNNYWTIPPFRHASAEEIEVFYKDLARMGKKWNAETLEIEEVEKLDISEIVVDYESAIKYLGIKDTLLVFKNYDRVEKFNAQIKLQLIAEAWNKFDEFEADWENSSQDKHYPIFRAVDGKIEFANTRFSGGTLDFQASNFSFKTKERARQFSEQFIDLFKVALGF